MSPMDATTGQVDQPNAGTASWKRDLTLMMGRSEAAPKAGPALREQAERWSRYWPFSP